MKNINLNDINEYYATRDKYDNSFLGKLTLKQRKLIHPILLNVIKLRNRGNKFKIETLNGKIEQTNRPKIFCITHIGKFDIEVVSEVIKEHYYLLSGDFENIKGTLEEKFLGLNGVIYLREDDKEDRKKSKEKMIQTLKLGGNIMYFPEGTWNLSPNLPVLQCPFGIIEVAQKSNAVIVPIGIEQYDKTFIATVGKNFDASKYSEDEKINAISDLRDAMATLKWDIWESVSPNVRSQMDENEFDKFISERLKEWPNFTLEEFYDRVFKPKNIQDEKNVFEFLKDLDIGTNNAFLAKQQLDYQKKYVKKRER